MEMAGVEEGELSHGQRLGNAQVADQLLPPRRWLPSEAAAAAEAQPAARGRRGDGTFIA